VKLLHLVGFITKKFVTMHGHMNVKKILMKQGTTVLMYETGRLLKQFYVCAFPQFSPGSYETKGPRLKEVTISLFFHLQFKRNGYDLIQQVMELCLN